MMYEVMTHPILGIEFVRIPAPPDMVYKGFPLKPFWMARMSCTDSVAEHVESKMTAQQWKQTLQVLSEVGGRGEFPGVDWFRALGQEIYKIYPQLPQVKLATVHEWEWAMLEGDSHIESSITIKDPYDVRITKYGLVDTMRTEIELVWDSTKEQIARKIRYSPEYEFDGQNWNDVICRIPVSYTLTERPAEAEYAIRFCFADF